MVFRNDLDAAQARIESLERQLRDLGETQTQLRGYAGDAENVDNLHRRMVAGIVILLVAGSIIGVLLYQAEMFPWSQLVVAFAVISAVMLGLARECVHVVPPGFALVLTGRSHEGADGKTLGFRVVTAGRVVRIPILEVAELIDCRSRTVECHISGAYSKDGGEHDVRAMVEYRLPVHSPIIVNAIERFLGRDVEDIDNVVRETVEGQIRAVIAHVTVEQLRTNNALVVQNVLDECDPDMATLGMEMGALTITVVKAANP